MSSPSTHESLLERLSAGDDPAAWEVFQTRYGDLIRDYGRRCGWQPSDCDDLLQDVLLSLTSALPGFRYDPAKGRLRGYLKTIAQRAVFKKTRQNPGHAALEQVEEPSAHAEERWEEAWRRHHVRVALERLSQAFPESTMTAFRLYVLEDHSPEEVASRVGISVDSVYQAKSRVMRRLSDLIAQQVREDG